MVWYGMVEVCEGAPVAVSGWVLTGRSRLTATGAPSQTSTITYHTIPTIPWVCYRRRSQWPRLALALCCLPLIWLARVVYHTIYYPGSGTD